jgi:DHA1 family multidrug resistance protein-like MFS transporter
MQKNSLLTLLLSVFIAFLGIGIIIPVMPVFAVTLGAGGLGLGMIIAAFSVTRGLLMPVVGNLSDKIGRKSFLAYGLLIYGAVGLLIPMANSVSHLIFIRGFHGVGSAMIVPVAMAYMSHLAPRGQEGKFMSYLNVAIFCGIGCGPLIGGFINDIFGFAAVFHLMALLSLVAFFLVVSQMPPHSGQEQGKGKSLLQSIKQMLNRRVTRGILLARYATMIIMVPTMAFLPLIMSGWPETTGLQIGLVIAARTLVNAMLQIPFGKLADRLNKLPFLYGSSIALAITVGYIPWIDTFLPMLVLYMVLGAIEAAVWAMLGGYASIEAKEYFGHGTMMGVFSLAMTCGVFTGALLTGISMDRLGIHWAYGVASGGILLLSTLAFWLIRSGQKKDGGLIREPLEKPLRW